MKVILLSDVKKVGKKGDVKEVSDGYARNFLIRQGLAVAYSDGSAKVLDKQNEEKAIEDERMRKEAMELAERLKGKTYVFKVKSSNGKVSGSVSSKQIEEALKSDGITIDKRKIKDTMPLTTLGDNDVKIELYKNVIGTIKVKLEEE